MPMFIQVSDTRKPRLLPGLGIIIACLMLLSGCTVVKVADVAVSTAVGVTVGAAKVTGKAVGAAIPDGDDEEEEEQEEEQQEEEAQAEEQEAEENETEATSQARQQAQQADAAFYEWLDELREEAIDQGFSEQSIDLAFSDITPPVQRVIQSDRNQPEVVQTYEQYLTSRVSEWRINKGREMLAEHDDLLTEIADTYGVQPHIIVAIWGMETNYGTFPVTEPVFNVLATLAYDNRRGAMFRAQFLAALTMLDRGYADYAQMKSSWAGAMGQPQFIPESYLQYAVDHDGDGKRDIWNNHADIFASIANYLRARGWRDDHGWGFPVAMPQTDRNLSGSQADGQSPASHCRRYNSLGAWHELSRWQERDIRLDGDTADSAEGIAALVMADSGDGQGYLVFSNFCTIMSYNASFRYALSIGLLADAITEG